MITILTLKLLRIRNEILLFATILISLAALAGWFLDIPLLKGDFRNYIPIAPIGSIGFILISVSIFIFFRTENYRLQLASKAVLAVFLVLAAIILADHIFKLSLDIEKVFGAISEPFGNVRKGRLSPVTAALFIVTFLSLFLGLSGGRYLRLSGQIMPVLLFGSSFLIITGYVYNTPFLYGGNIIPVSLPSALCFFMISLVLIDLFRINLIFKRLTHDSVIANRLAKAFLPISVLIVIIHGFIDAGISHTSANPALSAFFLLLMSITAISVIIYNIAKRIGISIEKIENEKLQIQTEKQEELKKQNEEYYALYEEYRTTSEELFQKNEALAFSNRRILDSELQYRRLFENMINGFALCRMIFDENQQPVDFVYLRVNNAFEKLTGLINVIGKSVSEVIPELKRTDPEIFNIYGRVALSGQSERFEMYVEALQMWFSISVFSPEIEHFVAVFDVITERKKAEEQLVIAKEKAEESDRLKTAFLQNMSHEIRTPMNAIMGFAQLLPENLDKKDKLELFSNIINQRCADLLEIINEILDISKIESGQLTVHFSECDLPGLFSELSDFFVAHQQRINKQNIRFDVLAHCETPHMIITDAVKLKQIFINLINNAFKFTDEGKIEAGCKLDKNKQFQFYVSDTGIGIPPDKQSVIFNRFSQLESNAVANKGGTGLGLAIVKGLIDILGGEITLESNVGVGSTFYFSIPYKATDRKNEVHTFIHTESGHLKFTGKTILIVEDDKFNMEYLKEVFKNTGFRMFYCESGQEAIEISSSQHVDVILMDIMLPDMQGYEATRMIKDKRPDIRIIAQTAYAGMEDKEKCFQAGCDDYISKPIKRNLLMDKVYEHLTKIPLSS